jgi:hypothetical protein
MFNTFLVSMLLPVTLDLMIGYVQWWYNMLLKETV